MSRTAIHSDRAPAAIGPYSQATRAGNLVFFSGQIPLDPATGELVGGDIAAQTRRAFDNLKAVLAAAGCRFDDVIDVTVFLVDAEVNFARAWAIVPEYWGQAPYPSLTGIGVSWLYGFQFEIKVVARLPDTTAA